jgi:hypothetical protein
MGQLKFDMPLAVQIGKELQNMGGLPIPDRIRRQERAVAMFPAAIDRIEELEGVIAENKKRWQAWMNTTDQKTIEKLQDDLCEAEAISLHNYKRYDECREAALAGRDVWKESPSWDDLPDEQRKAIIEVHREMLRVEGKL